MDLEASSCFTSTNQDSFLTIVFRMDLQSYLIIAIARMKCSTLQHKEAAILCESMIIAEQGMHFQYHTVPNR